MPLASNDRPIIDPAHRSQKGLSAQIMQQCLAEYPDTQKDGEPLPVGSAEQVGMPCCLDGVALPMDMGKDRGGCMFLVWALQVFRTENLAVMPVFGSTFCNQQIVPLVAKVDVRGFGRTSGYSGGE